MASEAPVIRLVNAMIAQASKSAPATSTSSRSRKSSASASASTACSTRPGAAAARTEGAIISRVKLMAKLNIAERRLPQDGRIKIKVLGREVDLRVSTLPTLYGESVVMRLLDRSAGDFYDLNAGLRRPHADPHGALHLAAARHLPGHRADRQRQIHHALLGAEAHQLPTRRSSPSRTRWSTRWTASTRSTSTRRSG
jgi:hypothetical protein